MSQKKSTQNTCFPKKWQMEYLLKITPGTPCAQLCLPNPPPSGHANCFYLATHPNDHTPKVSCGQHLSSASSSASSSSGARPNVNALVPCRLRGWWFGFRQLLGAVIDAMRCSAAGVWGNPRVQFRIRAIDAFDFQRVRFVWVHNFECHVLFARLVIPNDFGVINSPVF